MKFFFFISLTLLMSLPLYRSPIRLGFILLVTRVRFVVVISLLSSWWYSYILFLIYIGGLLVLFIYVCLIRRNHPFFNSSEIPSLLFFSSIATYLISLKPYSGAFLGGSCFDMASDLVRNGFLWLFLGLTVLLLVLLLVVVRSSGIGAISIN